MISRSTPRNAMAKVNAYSHAHDLSEDDDGDGDGDGEAVEGAVA